MKILSWSGLLLLVASSGCVEMDLKLRDPLARATPPPPAALAPPVVADQITPANARQMAQSLWDEFDREESAANTPPSRQR